MKTKITLVLAAMLLVVLTYAQEKPPTTIVETIYILPKRGMAEKFEAAVKAHNKKFHKEDPHFAALRSVMYGDMAGWYVWLMRGTYASLDSRPTKGDHDEDWNKTIDPLVEKYGQVGLWEMNAELSYGAEKLAENAYYNAWSVDLKTGKYSQFKALISRIRAAYESMGNRAFIVTNNAVPSSGSADVGLIWSFNKFEELDNDWGTKEAYEKIYGEGSWRAMVDEWQSITNSIDTEIRSMLND